ncbi:hypothetical protein ACFVIM_22910 [Streptomyces sp. NPDC057638]|uniref:hypothetical protein n=1 Tax=Streptomyces sp. NPDC057638 TaxID=3346190 RepID=UPI0036A86D6B
MVDRVELTEADRLERLRAMLSGQRATARVGKALESGPYGNVLVGVLLHGADRLRQGQTPTDLEQLLLDVVRTAFPEEEIRRWGGVYREAVTAQGRLGVVPEAITGLPVEQGCTTADLRAVFAQVVEEALASPNVQIADPHAAAAGEPEDPEFLAAMRERGFAVTAYRSASGAAAAGTHGTGQEEGAAAEGDAGAGSPAALPTFRVKLEMDHFYVRRAVGDQGGGRDEIYWTASTGGSDGGSGTFESEEFGALGQGDRRYFSAGNKVLFDGRSSGFIGTSIQVWEADQSNAEWYEELRKALVQAAASLETLMMMDGFIGFLPTWVGVSFEIGKVFIFLMEYLRNYDDLSCQRAIGMDRQDLAVLARRGEAIWTFDGDGHHDLKVTYTGDPIPFPAGTLEYQVRTGTSWSAPIPLAWQSASPPALASYSGKLYAVFVRPGDNAVMWTRLENQTWRTPERVGGDGSFFAPALTAAHGRLYYAVTGSGDKLWWRTFTESGGWSSIMQFPGYQSAYGPALATHPHTNGVFLSYLDSSGRENVTFHNGAAWAGPYRDKEDWMVNNAAALAPLGEHLWRVCNGTDDKVYSSRWVYEHGWRNVDTFTWRTSHSPALATHGNLMWVFMTGLNGALYAATCDNRTWSAASVVPGAKPIGAPAAASHASKLYVMYCR